MYNLFVPRTDICGPRDIGHMVMTVIIGCQECGLQHQHLDIYGHLVIGAIPEDITGGMAVIGVLM